MTLASVLMAIDAGVEVGVMRRICQRPGRSAGVDRMGRAIVGLFFLVLAVTATQAVAGAWPAAARNTPAPSGTASDTLLAWGGGEQ